MHILKFEQLLPIKFEETREVMFGRCNFKIDAGQGTLLPGLTELLIHFSWEEDIYEPNKDELEY